MPKMLTAMRQDRNGRARLERWNRGTYVFLGNLKHSGQEVVMMKKASQSEPFVLDFVTEYFQTTDFVPGTGFKCAYCEERKDLLQDRMSGKAHHMRTRLVKVLEENCFCKDGQ